LFPAGCRFALRRTIFLLALAAFASAASMRVTDAMLPRIAADFDVGIAGAAAVITGFAIAYGVMQMVFGPLGDRFGKLRVIAGASGAAAAASAACFFAGDFAALVAARAIAGGFCACIIPLAMAWIGDNVDYRDRQPVLARFMLGQILGFAGGAAVGGFAAEDPAWRWPFTALAAWFAVAAVLIALESRGSPRPARPAQGGPRTDVKSILGTRWARIVVGTVSVEGLLVFGALAFIPTHLHYVRGVPLSRAGLALLAFASGGILFAVFARALVRMFGEVRLAQAGTAMLAFGLATVALAPGALFAAAGCLVAGLGFYCLHNTLQTNATQMAPERRGAAVAMFASLFFLGQAIGVAIAGGLAEHFGTTAVLTGMAVAVVPVGLNFARLRAARPAD
jgi:predicted MFS family arabinose efflux permease